MKRVTTDDGTLLVSDVTIPVSRTPYAVRVHHPADSIPEDADASTVWIADRSVPRGTVVKAYPRSRPLTIREQRHLLRTVDTTEPGDDAARRTLANELAALYTDGVSVAALAEITHWTIPRVRRLIAHADVTPTHVRLVCLLPVNGQIARTARARASSRYRSLTRSEQETLLTAYRALPVSNVDGRHLFHNPAGDVLLELIVTLTTDAPPVAMRSICHALNMNPSGWLHRTVAQYRRRQRATWPPLDDTLTEVLTTSQQRDLRRARDQARRWGEHGRIAWGSSESDSLRNWMVMLLDDGWTPDDIADATGIASSSITAVDRARRR